MISASTGQSGARSRPARAVPSDSSPTPTWCAARRRRVCSSMRTTSRSTCSPAWPPLPRRRSRLRPATDPRLRSPLPGWRRSWRAGAVDLRPTTWHHAPGRTRDQGVAHPRLTIGPPLDLRQLALFVQLLGIGLCQPLNELKMPSQITTRPVEQIDTLTAPRPSAVRHPRPRTRPWSIHPSCGSHRRWHRHAPADTVPVAKASSNPGITEHTRSRSSAVASILHRTGGPHEPTDHAAPRHGPARPTGVDGG